MPKIRYKSSARIDPNVTAADRRYRKRQRQLRRRSHTYTLEYEQVEAWLGVANIEDARNELKLLKRIPPYQRGGRIVMIIDRLERHVRVEDAN